MSNQDFIYQGKHWSCVIRDVPERLFDSLTDFAQFVDMSSDALIKYELAAGEAIESTLVGLRLVMKTYKALIEKYPKLAEEAEELYKNKLRNVSQA